MDEWIKVGNFSIRKSEIIAFDASVQPSLLIITIYTKSRDKPFILNFDYIDEYRATLNSLSNLSLP